MHRLNRIVAAGVWVTCLSACTGDVRKIDVRDFRNAAVFLAHVDSDDVVVETSGPFLVDDAGIVEDASDESLLAFGERTEVLSFSIDQLVAETAARDASPRARVQYRPDAPCLIEKTCSLELAPSTTLRRFEVLRDLGESVGFLETSIDASLLLNELGDNESVAQQLKLRIPFDLELVEQERLVPFGGVEEWSLTIPGTSGILEFEPLNESTVVISSGEALCFVRDTTPASQICTGADRLEARSFGADIDQLRYVTRARGPTGELLDRIVVGGLGDRSHLFLIDVNAGGFGAVTEWDSSELDYDGIAVGPGGTVMVVISRDDEEPEGELFSQEYPFNYVPGSGAPPRSLIATNSSFLDGEDAIQNSEFVATNDPRVPFLSGTENEIHLRNSTSTVSAWSTRDFLKGDGNFKVKGLAGVSIGEATAIWSAHNNGRLLQYFGSMNTEPRGIEVVMPNEYLRRCEPVVFNDPRNKTNRTLSDHRALAVRSRHDGFVLLESCAVLVWFDPDAPINEERISASIFRGDEVDQAWPRINTRTPQQVLRFTDNHVWVGGGRYFRHVLRPPL